MKKLLIIALLLPMTGCYSFGRGVASRVMETLDMEKRRQDTRQCEIRGSFFNGISSYLKEGEIVKVFYVHGIGTHQPGHSTIISENIARSLGLDVFTRPKDVAIMNPGNPEQRLANLRIIDMRDPNASRKLIFYELTWSEITSEIKRVLDFDTSGEYAHRRASFNNSMKAFLNDVSPDVMIYMADRPNLILSVFMLSNQLVSLQIGLPPPNVFGRIDSYCRVDGEHYGQRAFKKLNIMAFNDPNDLLCYSIPRDFVDRYLDSRV